VSINSIANDIFAWLKSDSQNWLQTACIIAKTREDTRELQDFLLGLIAGGDTPGVKALREKLGEEGLKAIERRGLPWSNIWSFVAVDLTFENWEREK
jgi:hypothetical protein